MIIGAHIPLSGEQTTFSGLMSQGMTPLACAVDRISVCGTNEDRRPNVWCKESAYNGDCDPKRIFEAQRTIVMEVSFQIHSASLHAQVTDALEGTPVI